MKDSFWFSAGDAVGDDIVISEPISCGLDWQTYATAGNNQMLVAKESLVNKWASTGLLDKDVFSREELAEEVFYTIRSGHGYALAPVDQVDQPARKEDALSFAVSLKASCELLEDRPLGNAIFIERLSRLLPTNDDRLSELANHEILGFWLSGGVKVSALDFRKLYSLCWRIPVDDLIETVTAAGFDVPKDAHLLGSNRSSLAKHRRAKIDEVSPEAESAGEEILGSVDATPKSSDLKPDAFSLPGRPFLEEFFNEHIIDIIYNPQRYQAVGIEFPSAVILHGPPGCGKTFAVEKLSEFIGWPTYSIDSNSVGSPYIHETSKKISETFDKAIDSAPSIVVIDEMEAFLASRQSASSSGSHRIEEVAEFLRRIPEAINNRVLILAMTNMIEAIDPAILRRGRFDHILEVGMPSKEEIFALFSDLLRNVPHDPKLDLENLSKTMEGRPLSDCAFVIREAARLTAKHDKGKVDEESLAKASQSLPPVDVSEKPRKIGFVWDEKE
jgi:hypothetical protein